MILNPAWFVIALGVVQLIFAAGVVFGGLRPLVEKTNHQDEELRKLRTDVDKLADLPKDLEKLGSTIEEASKIREKQIETLTEIRTMTNNMQGEVTRLRDQRHGEPDPLMATMVARIAALERLRGETN